MSSAGNLTELLNKDTLMKTTYVSTSTYCQQRKATWIIRHRVINPYVRTWCAREQHVLIFHVLRFHVFWSGSPEQWTTHRGSHTWLTCAVSGFYRSWMFWKLFADIRDQLPVFALRITPCIGLLKTGNGRFPRLLITRSSYYWVVILYL